MRKINSGFFRLLWNFFNIFPEKYFSQYLFIKFFVENFFCIFSLFFLFGFEGDKMELCFFMSAFNFNRLSVKLLITFPEDFIFIQMVLSILENRFIIAKVIDEKWNQYERKILENRRKFKIILKIYQKGLIYKLRKPHKSQKKMCSLKKKKRGFHVSIV
jgi:hypothetical protein